MDRNEYQQFRNGVRRLAEKKIAPYAAAVDREARFPEEALSAFKQMELLALPFDERHGGQSGDVLSQAICLEEIARVCASSSLTLMVIWAGLVPIDLHGNDELVAEVIGSVVKNGDTVASICLTEAHGGSNLWGLATTARKGNKGWVLKGQKRFISNATRSDWYTVLAKTSESEFGLFAVNRNDAGLSFGAPESKMGVRGSPTADVLLEDVYVPDYRCIGDSGAARRYITDSLTYTRPMIAAQAVGIAQGAVDAAVKFVKEREVFGKALDHYQLIKGAIAEMATKVEASRRLLYEACAAVQEGRSDARMLASMAKLAASDAAMEVTTRAVQLHGGAGYLTDYPVERMMRDAKITQIYEGTSEIQKLIIAKAVLAKTELV